MGSESDWPELLRDYQAAVRNFESLSAALTAALAACYPLDADFLALVASEERVRETVTLARMRLINHWRDSIEERKLLQTIGSPDRADPG